MISCFQSSCGWLVAALDGSREEDSQGGGSASRHVKSSRVSSSSGTSSLRYSGDSRGEGRRRRNIGWLMFRFVGTLLDSRGPLFLEGR